MHTEPEKWVEWIIRGDGDAIDSLMQAYPQAFTDFEVVDQGTFPGEGSFKIYRLTETVTLVESLGCLGGHRAARTLFWAHFNMIKVIPFVKYHGLGNDWLVVRASDLPSGLAQFARKILDRHTGAGADGLIVVMKPEGRGHDARIRFFNADGSEAEMSGNGIRCAGAFLSGTQAAKAHAGN